jgi:hypothetical protein
MAFDIIGLDLITFLLVFLSIFITHSSSQKLILVLPNLQDKFYKLVIYNKAESSSEIFRIL